MALGGAGRAVVIGGGLAGLAVASRLSDAAWHVTVLEKDNEVGGRCRTLRDSGFLFDTGAQHFHDSYDGTLTAAIRNGLGASFRVPPEAKGIYVDGALDTFIPRDLNPIDLLPWEATGPAGLLELATVGASFLRGYRNYNIRFPESWTRGNDRTALDFLARRSNARYRQNVAEPVSLYALGAGLESVSSAALMVALRYTFFDRTGGFIEGMGSLPEALSSKPIVIKGMEALEVLREGGRATGVKARPANGGRSRTYKADFVICSVPAPLALDIVGPLGAAAESFAKQVEYAAGIVVNLAFNGRSGGPGGPVLLPSSQGFHAAWLCKGQSKAAEYAPADAEVITAVFGGDEARGLLSASDDELLTLASVDADRAFGTGKLELSATAVSRHDLGRPVVSVGHSSRLRELLTAGTGTENLLLAGDWTMSPTVEGAVASGERAADTALALRGAQQ